jgi:carbamoyltransferase
MSHTLGVSAGFHDAAVTVVKDNGEIVFAGHSERYSKQKNDAKIHPALLNECCDYNIDTVAFYERPWMHNVQQFVSRQKLYGPWTAKSAIRQHLGEWYQTPATREVAFPHHLSHAAAGFQTSTFDSAAVVVIDAIGELDTISIYRAWFDNHGRAHYKKLWGQRYPHSIGLFYSAVTAHVGLRPMDEEYITMGMAAYGSNHAVDAMEYNLIDDYVKIKLKQNLHLGIQDGCLARFDNDTVATSAQTVVERLISAVMHRAQQLTGETNLVYMGGVALNCLANRLLGKYFDNFWIMPNPGDAGSSLGAAALAYRGRLSWKDAYLGHVISGAYPVDSALQILLTDRIVGVASGAAEFGPRALGNRSLLADPRGHDIKDQVNEIKRRQQFRPFAPVILSECVDEYFDMPAGWRRSPYMQSVAVCRRPDLYPAIVHHDGTSRVQTVSPSSRSGIRQLLEAWYKGTGCPMLLNTSLNIRGEPMVNDRIDADRFENLYNVKVVS